VPVSVVNHFFAEA